jgi:hypothetical protein
MRYVTIYFDEDPSARADLYGFPVEVAHGDGTSHWEGLMGLIDYSNLDKKDAKTFSKIEKDMAKQKWLRRNGAAFPRHVFGPPGNLGDPELEPEPEPED